MLTHLGATCVLGSRSVIGRSANISEVFLHPSFFSHHTMDAFEFKRSQDEYTLMDIGIGLDAAIRVYKQRQGVVNLDIFLDKMDEELVRDYIISSSSLLTLDLQNTVCTMYDPYPHGVTVPHFHPLIEYLATLWDNTPEKENFYDAISFKEIAAKCAEKPHPPGYDEFSKSDLTSFVNGRVPPERRWWLRPDALGVVDGDGDAGTFSNMWQYIGYLCNAHICVDMADPNVEHVVEDAPDSSDGGDERSGGDDEYMDDGGPTPRRSARTSAKRAIISSPPGQPPTQRSKIDYSAGVSILSVNPIRPLIHRISENVDIAIRKT